MATGKGNSMAMKKRKATGQKPSPEGMPAMKVPALKKKAGKPMPKPEIPGVKMQPAKRMPS